MPEAYRLHAWELCNNAAAGYNLRWLMRAVVRLGLKGFFARFFYVCFFNLAGLHQPSDALSAASTGARKTVDGLKLNFAGPTG